MEIEVDGIISSNLAEPCDCGMLGCEGGGRDHYPRALFEFLSDGTADHTPKELEEGYCDHYNYGDLVNYPSSNGLVWSDVMSDKESGSVKRYDSRLKEYSRRRVAQARERLGIWKEPNG